MEITKAEALTILYWASAADHESLLGSEDFPLLKKFEANFPGIIKETYLGFVYDPESRTN
jgi:hypothetical protein